MTMPLSDVRQFQQVAQVVEQVLAVDLGVVAQHQVAVGVDDPQLRPVRGGC
jgi:hypothetical protein